MKIYSKKNDQIDIITRFFSKKSIALALVVSVILGVSAFMGWSYWRSYQENMARHISSVYEQSVSTLNSGQPEVLRVVEKFATDQKNVYGVFASLELAQQFVNKNQLKNAEKQLRQGLAVAADDNLKSVINMRLSRIQLEMKQPEAALKTLNCIKGEGWKAIIADLRGEILLSQGDKQRALTAWEAGIKSNTLPILREMMRMKMNNLSI